MAAVAAGMLASAGGSAAAADCSRATALRIGTPFFFDPIVFTDSPSRTCTSSDQTWKATRSPQPRQHTYPVAPGSYSGQNSQNGNGVEFVVAAGAARW